MYLALTIALAVAALWILLGLFRLVFLTVEGWATIGFVFVLITLNTYLGLGAQAVLIIVLLGTLGILSSRDSK
jgi:hypothetical protein|tara:strand:+ start:1028 stop:1246 length:219 start_codon:yes stop_codon:yes gene_type:complete